jgi:hypothetical protein
MKDFVRLEDGSFYHQIAQYYILFKATTTAATGATTGVSHDLNCDRISRYNKAANPL